MSFILSQKCIWLSFILFSQINRKVIMYIPADKFKYFREIFGRMLNRHIVMENFCRIIFGRCQNDILVTVVANIVDVVCVSEQTEA